MKRIFMLLFICLIFVACTKIEPGVFNGILDDKSIPVPVKIINQKTAVSIQALSELCGWECLACGRCGDDQVDYHGGDILLIKWNQNIVINSSTGTEIHLPVINTVEDDITWVSIKILDYLKYKYKLDNKQKTLTVTKTAIVIERETNESNSKKIMTQDELKEIINTKILWNGKKNIIENAEYALIDVRTPEEFSEGHIPLSVNYPLDTLKQGIPAIPKDRKIIVYCKSGKRSSEARLILRRQGFENVENYGGIDRWSDPVETGLEGLEAEMLLN